MCLSLFKPFYFTIFIRICVFLGQRRRGKNSNAVVQLFQGFHVTGRHRVLVARVGNVHFGLQRFHGLGISVVGEGGAAVHHDGLIVECGQQTIFVLRQFVELDDGFRLNVFPMDVQIFVSITSRVVVIEAKRMQQFVNGHAQNSAPVSERHLLFSSFHAHFRIAATGKGRTKV